MSGVTFVTSHTWSFGRTPRGPRLET
ncbi:MAG: hypothetical protein ACI82N_001592, partial [Maricaulis sp.]